jgi:diguanylate cyclase (GGDEF)-like protein
MVMLLTSSGPAQAVSFDLTALESDYLSELREKPLVLAYSFDLLYSAYEGEEHGMLLPLIDFMRNQLGIELRLRKTAWKDAFTAVEDGAVDFLGIVSLPEAKKRKYITSGPIFYTSAQIVTAVERPLGSELALRNKKVGLLIENIARDGITSYLHPDGAVLYYESMPALLDALQTGEIDCILALNNTEIEIISRPGVRHEFADQNFKTAQYLVTANEDLKPLMDILNRFLGSPEGGALRAAVERARIDAIIFSAKKLFAEEIEYVRKRYSEVRMIDGGDMYPLSFIENGGRKGFMLEINEIFESLTGIPLVIQDLDNSNANINSTAYRVRSGRTHFALDAYTNPEFARDPSLTYSLPIWVDNIRTYSYRDTGGKPLGSAAVGTTLNGLTYVNWDVSPGNRPKIFNSRTSLLDALKRGQVDVAFMSEMAYNYQCTILRDYDLREFDDTQALVSVKMMCGAQNTVLNRLYNEAILLRQALYPDALDRWKHISDRYKSDYIRLRESRRSTLQYVVFLGSVMLITILYAFRRLSKYDSQISRLIRKQQTFDLAWGDLKTGRFISKGNNPIFRNWGFELRDQENNIDEMSKALGKDMRAEYSAEMEYMKNHGVDMTVSQKMMVSPKNNRKMYYRRYLHYLNDHEFMECLQDVTEEIDSLNTLSTAAATDFLSKLLTRGAMNDKLLQKCGELTDGAGRAFLIMIDIDDFKKVNDVYGHDAGDDVLKNVSSIIKETVGADGMTARWGGEEFLVMLNCADIDAAEKRAWAIVSAVEASEVRICGTEKIIKTTVSAGMAELHPGKHYSTSVTFSDKALYDAKRSGKNTVRVWNPHLKQSI